MAAADPVPPASAPTPGPGGDRYCPTCGRRSNAIQCPHDGAQTVQMRGFGRHPRNYQVGDVVAGRYRITGTLGAGGMAAVYAAEHTSTLQPVAIKLMAAEPGADGDVAMRRFFREARVTATLQHPNTVRVFDVGQDDQGPLFMAMERINGPTLLADLRDRITAGRLMTQSEAIDVGIQTLDSLGEAHGHQLVHRDLKPANLMLIAGEDGAPMVKVLDFGIARTVDSSLTATGAAPGTPAYMSPEQCKGETVDGRSDLYSLAVILFVCVTGRLPFDHKDPLRLMQAHVNAPPPDPRPLAKTELHENFVSVLHKAMAKKPGDRFSSAATMREALMAVAQNRPLPVDAGVPMLADDATLAHVRPSNPARRMETAAVELRMAAVPPVQAQQSAAVAAVRPADESTTAPQIASEPAAKSASWLPRVAIGLVGMALLAGAAVALLPKSAPTAAAAPSPVTQDPLPQPAAAPAGNRAPAGLSPAAALVEQARARAQTDAAGALQLVEAALALDAGSAEAKALLAQLQGKLPPSAAGQAPTAPVVAPPAAHKGQVGGLKPAGKDEAAAAKPAGKDEAPAHKPAAKKQAVEKALILD